MARFQLTQAVWTGQEKLHAGQFVTDTIPLTIPTDRYWPGLTAATMVPGMVPVDGPASAMKSASRYAGEVISAPTGAASVDG